MAGSDAGKVAVSAEIVGGGRRVPEGAGESFLKDGIFSRRGLPGAFGVRFSVAL